MDETLVAITTAAVGAIFGVFTKGAYDAIVDRRRATDNRLRELRRLGALLRQSRDVFVNQNFKARALKDSLANRGLEIPVGVTFNHLFIKLRDEMTEEEREIYSLIRGTTINSMFPLNEELMVWLDEFSWDASGWGREGEVFLQELRGLQEHLHDWLNQYHSLFLADERHSLVYTADEMGRGREFPPGLERALEQVKERLE